MTVLEEPGSSPGPGARSALPAPEARWAGALLALGGLLFMLGVILGLEAFDGEWDTSLGPTLPETAALIQERWTRFRVIWLGELIGALLIAVAAFLLQRRPQAGARWLPASVAWVVVGVGSMIVAVSYAITLGGYPPALAAFGEEPDLFAALRGASLYVHAVGSTLQLLGLIGIYVTELRWKGQALPERLLHGGAAVALLAVVAATAGLISPEYSAAGIFFAAVVLGTAIWSGAGVPASQASSSS